MAESPPRELLDLLERLGLPASAARRFMDHWWVDGLVEVRRLLAADVGGPHRYVAEALADAAPNAVAHVTGEWRDGRLWWTHVWEAYVDSEEEVLRIARRLCVTYGEGGEGAPRRLHVLICEYP